MSEVVRMTMCDWNGDLATEMEKDAVKFGFTILEVGPEEMGLTTYTLEGEWANLLNFSSYYDLEFDDED